jgi:hypothetical protein
MAAGNVARVTSADLVQFWAQCDNLQAHPADAAMLQSRTHNFGRDPIIGPWMGPIHTAPVVLLTLNGSLAGTGEEAAAMKVQSAREEMARTLQGRAPLYSFQYNPAGRIWTDKRLGAFGLTYQIAADKVAFINLMAYKSRNGADDLYKYGMDALPSTQYLLRWTRDTLFPEAEAGKRVVVCLMSAIRWGLTPGQRRGSLYSPWTTYFNMHYDQKGGPTVDEITMAVRRAVHGIERPAA